MPRSQLGAIAIVVAVSGQAFAQGGPSSPSERGRIGENPGQVGQPTRPGQSEQSATPTASARAGDTLSATEVELLSTLHGINQMEIEAGQMARTKAFDPAVQRYGVELVRDHMQADHDVTQLAQRRGATLRAADAQTGADAQHQAKLERLRQARGSDFDRRFTRMMVQDHASAIRAVQRGQQQARDEELRSLLDELLPVLERHRDTAQALADSPRPETGGNIGGMQDGERSTRTGMGTATEPAPPGTPEPSRGRQPQRWDGHGTQQGSDQGQPGMGM